MHRADYYYNLVAFIDILGQKESFQVNGKYIDTMSEYIDNPTKMKKALAEADRQTAAFIEDLRTKFESFFASYTSPRAIPESIPEEKKSLYSDLRKSEINFQVFSDCILTSTSFRTLKYHSNAINGVYGILMACGSLLFYSLAKKKPFRAGIDVGLITQLRNEEIYGPALFRAYELESKKAQFPRIVIGDELIKYLRDISTGTPQLQDQTREDIEWCRKLSKLCLEMIKIDIDGCAILDYLGNPFMQQLQRSLGKKYPIMFSHAHEFVKAEYKRWKQLGDEKLALRYHLLNSYFSARMS